MRARWAFSSTPSRWLKGQGEEDGPIGTGPVGGYAPSASWISLPVMGGSKTLITWTSLSALTWCRSLKVDRR